MAIKSIIKFAPPEIARNEIEFVLEVKAEVKRFIEQLPNSGKGDYRLFIKTIVIFLLLCESYAVIFVPAVFGSWMYLSLAYCQMGFILALIGFNVMHDASHGSYSSNDTLNIVLAHSLNFIGGILKHWKIKHDEDHHIRTNIIGYDEDVELYPVFVTTPYQKRYLIHKYQDKYAWLMYFFAGFVIVHVNDFVKFFKKTLGSKATPVTCKDRIIFVLSKSIHFYIFIGIPAHTIGWKHALVGYFVMVNVTGCVMSIVFQLAHLFKTAKVEKMIKVPHKWEVYQLMVSADFAVKNKFVSWAVGGLNFQAIHHIFSNISHIHYPKIQEIVERLAIKYGITYNVFPSVRSAWQSHRGFLKDAGNSPQIVLA